MASRTLEIVVNQSGNATKGIDGLNTSLGKVEPAAKKASQATGDLTGSLKGLASQYGPALGIAGVTAAIGSYAVESSKAAMQSARLEGATDKLGAKFGVTGDQIVASMKDASLGTINSMVAMEKANLAMSLGVIKSAEDFKTLTEGATVLGRAVGLDATQALDSLVIGLGRGSTEVLDNLGITLKAAEAQEIYAAKLGKSASELTEVEKKQAFQSVALDKIREKTAELGGVQEDQLTKLERSSAAWADLQVKSGEVINTFVAATGILDGLNTVMDYMLENVTAVSGAMEQGLGQGLLQIFDNANPVTQLLERFGVDIIPDFVEASTAATEAVNTQAQAHQTAAAAVAEQEAAIQGLSLSQINTLAQMGQMEEAYNEKKEELLSRRLEAESAAAEATAENARTLNQQLTDNERERAERIKEINEKAAQDRDRNSGVEYQREIEKANQHFDERRTKIQESYTAENEDIKAKLNERQRAIDEQLEKERQQYEEKAQELKLIMAAQALEQSGQLEEMTGIAGITAEQYVQAVKFGAIEANREVETAMAGIVRTFEGHQKSQESIARTNAESIKRILGESATSSANSWKQATNSIVSDFERQAKAAYDARMAQTGSVSYSGGAGWSSRGARFAQGGSFTVPPGYPNDSFPMWVESGERVTVIPRDQASRMPKFANGTGISKVDQATNQARNLGYLNIDKSLQELQQYSSSVLAVASSRELLDFFGGGGDLKNAVKRAADLDKRIAASRVAAAGLIKRPATKGTPSTANARRAKAKTASLTSTASPVSAAAPSMSTPSTGHTGQPMFNITIQYSPTIALGTQYELVQAIKPAFEELARLYKIPVSV
jgi:hypothetical protein